MPDQCLDGTAPHRLACALNSGETLHKVEQHVRPLPQVREALGVAQCRHGGEQQACRLSTADSMQVQAVVMHASHEEHMHSVRRTVYIEARHAFVAVARQWMVDMDIDASGKGTTSQLNSSSPPRLGNTLHIVLEGETWSFPLHPLSERIAIVRHLRMRQKERGQLPA